MVKGLMRRNEKVSLITQPREQNGRAGGGAGKSDSTLPAVEAIFTLRPVSIASLQGQ